MTVTRFARVFLTVFEMATVDALTHGVSLEALEEALRATAGGLAPVARKLSPLEADVAAVIEPRG